MDKIARPTKFDIAPNAPSSSKHWKLWLRNFKYFLTQIEEHTPDKLEVLFLHIGTNVVDAIQDCTTYEDAMKKLDAPTSNRQMKYMRDISSPQEYRNLMRAWMNFSSP